MIVAALLAAALGALPQEPLAVAGRVELTPAAAVAAARERAFDELRYEIERRARSVAEQRAPFWMPPFAVDLVVDRWGRSLRADALLEEVRRDTRVHDHGGYKSFQTFLAIRHDETRLQRSLQDLARRIDRGSREFLAKCGGTVALWGILGVCYLWLDRLTRGYMGWRLRFVLGGTGLALPALAFLLV